MADRTLASCDIENMEAGPNGPGFYYTITDETGSAEPIGPFADEGAAETAFREHITEVMIEMTKKHLGV